MLRSRSYSDAPDRCTSNSYRPYSNGSTNLISRLRKYSNATKVVNDSHGSKHWTTCSNWTVQHSRRSVSVQEWALVCGLVTSEAEATIERSQDENTSLRCELSGRGHRSDGERSGRAQSCPVTSAREPRHALRRSSCRALQLNACSGRHRQRFAIDPAFEFGRVRLLEIEWFTRHRQPTKLTETGFQAK